MTIQTSDAVANAQLDAAETAMGPSVKLAIFSGNKPTNCAAADPAGELLRITCPADYFAAANARSKAYAPPWTATATGTGNAASFRIYASNGTTCHMQGTVTATGGGGDMTVDNVSIAPGQTVTVTAFTLTNAGNQ